MKWMSATLEEKLTKLLEEAEDWKKIRTVVPGVFIVKIPGSKKKAPSLALEINPADKTGKPTKKRGLYIMNRDEYEIFKEILTTQKVEQLITAIEKIKKKSAIEEPKKEEEIFEF